MVCHVILPEPLPTDCLVCCTQALLAVLHGKTCCCQSNCGCFASYYIDSGQINTGKAQASFHKQARNADRDRGRENMHMQTCLCACGRYMHNKLLKRQCRGQSPTTGFPSFPSHFIVAQKIGFWFPSENVHIYL